MVSEPRVEFAGDHLGRVTAGGADDGQLTWSSEARCRGGEHWSGLVHLGAVRSTHSAVVERPCDVTRHDEDGHALALSRARADRDAPIVTSTENNPLATRSVMSSMFSSVARGSFSFSYVVRRSASWEEEAGGWWEADEVLGDGDAAERDGASEKSEGARTR